jgi:hypothetical protein
MANLQDWVPDVQATVLDGMNRGVEPELINENQAHLLRNVSIRGGRVRSRPRIVKRTTLPAGLLQGGTVFGRVSSVLVSVGGRVYELDPTTWTSAERTGADVNSPNQPRAYFCETVGTVVMQDAQSRPFIYDGATFRRSADDEVPVGRAMAFGNGRLAVVVNAGFDVRIGDIRQAEHQTELKFTETYNLTGGGDLSFPSEVMSLSVLPVIDTGSGQGTLIVGCRDSVHTLKTQITQRDLWPEVGFQTVLLPSRGIAGHAAVAAVNQDLYFRSSDGLRSVRTSTADYDAPGLAPLSVEVRHRFEHDASFLLDDASVVYFDNRLLCTHSPFVYSSRSLSQGIISLNFDALSGRGHKSAPAFDGEWDGLIIAQIFTGNVRGVDRCFALGRDADGSNGLWEILPETAQPVGDSPTQVIETRTMFAGHPGVLKNLRRCDLQFSEILQDLSVRVYFRPEKYPYWVRWDEFNVPAAAATSWGKPRARRSPILSTRTVTDKVDEQTGRLLSVATGFQVRVEFEGFARLDFLQVIQEGADGIAYSDTPVSGEQVVLTAAPDGTVDPAFWHAHPVSPLAGIL